MDPVDTGTTAAATDESFAAALEADGQSFEADEPAALVAAPELAAVAVDDGSDPDAAAGNHEAVERLLNGNFAAVDANGSITNWSARAEETFCWERPEVAGRPLTDAIVAPGSRDEVGGELAGVLAGGPGRVLKLSAADKHERQFPAELALVPIGLAAGYPFNSLLTDLTNQGHGAEALARIRREHGELLDSIAASLAGAAPEDPGERVVGALVVFEDLGPFRPEVTDDTPPANVPPVIDPAELEDARKQAEQAWREAQEANARADEVLAELESAREAGEAVEKVQGELDEARAAAGEAAAEAEARAVDLTTRLEQAQTDLSELRETAEARAAELEELSEIADARAAELEELRETADARAAELEELRGTADGRATELDATRAAMEERERELAELRESVEARTSELDDARAELERRNTELEELRTDRDERTRELEELRASTEGHESDVAELGAALDERTRELDDLREKAERRKSDLKEARAEIEARDSELEQLRASGEGREGDLAELRATLDERTRELEELHGATEERDAELAELRESLQARADELGEAQQDLAQRNRDLDDLRARVEELSGEIKDSEAAEARIEELEAAAEGARKALEAARAEAERLGADLEDKSNALAELREGSGEAEQRAAELEERLADARAEIDEAQRKASEAESANEAVQKQLVDARREAAEATEQAEAARTTLAQARAAAGEAGEEVVGLRERVEAAETEVTQAREQAEEVRARAEAVEAELAEARRQADLVRLRAEAAEEELAQAREQADGAGAEAEETKTRLAAAAEQAAEAERFRLAFDEAPIGMALTGTDGRFLRVNRSLCNLLGYEADVLLSDDPPTVVHEDDLEAKRELATRMLAGDAGTSQAETRYCHADGRVLHVKETVSLATGGGGEPLYFVFQFEDITERKELEEAAAEALDRDPVTGLFNQRRFEEELSRKIAEAARHGGGGAAVLLGLKDFDSVALPAEAGEEVLRTVAGALREHLRNAELLARLSGDEFAVLLPDADAERAQSVAEELVQAIGPQVVKVGDQSIRVTLSVGVALFDERDHHAGPVAVTATAEATDGANLPVPAKGASLAPSDGAAVTPERVHKALEDDLFLLYCQPVVDLRTNEVAQYELLLRMLDDDGNLILPRAFLQTAEESGLIRSIDQWVVRRAIRLIAERAQSGRQLKLEVNISHSSIRDPDLPAVIEHELIATGIDPSNLILEVAEPVAVADHDQVKDLAKRVRALGCKFAVDNFGSSVTSVRYIKDLPLDFLKLDGDLIATLPESRTDQLVVKAIVDIARGMSCQTIAEMVSDDETLFLLRQQGADFAQGYQVGRPQPVTEV